ncbi:MAG: hypothetical protein NT123_19540 [Proteobacteria bacterium]|nr:hypothetical protein [Pseudomonadota bacterium]
MRAVIFIVVSSAATIIGAIAAILGTWWIHDIAYKMGQKYDVQPLMAFVVGYLLSIVLYAALARLIAIVAKSRALECNVVAGALANILITALTATSTKARPGGWIDWADALEFYVSYYLPDLSIFPVFLLVGWLAKRRLALNAVNTAPQAV